jgi:integrase
MKELLELVKKDFPDKATSISKRLQNLNEIINSIMTDINGKINTAFYHRDFENMRKYSNLAKCIHIYEKKIGEIIDFIDIENNPTKSEISKQTHNNDLKQKFLNKYSENTQYYMKYIIFSDAARMMEEKSGQDLCAFTKEELLHLIVQSNPYSLQSAITQLSVFRKYIDFAITEGYLTSDINPANFIKMEDIKNVLDKEAMQLKYLTMEELIDMVNSLNNAIDAAFLMLLFEGVKGEGLNEIINLKKDDINYDNGTLKLSGRDELKKISSQTLHILKLAANQNKYTVIVNTEKRNLEFTKRLPDNEYIIRTTGLRSKGPVKYRTLLARIRSIKDEIGNNFLTVTSIWESGMIHYAKEMMQQRNLAKLSTEHHKEISRWAGRSEDLWFSTKRLITNFK